MKQHINRFTAYTNCPSGEYWSIFAKSDIKKYPKGEREILTFLILGNDGLPIINKKDEACYSVIVCNKSKGESPKSKISKIKNTMLSKEEYDPIACRLGLPNINTFYGRKFKIRVTKKDNNLTFITHIQRPRDNIWKSIEGIYEGNLKVKKNLKLFLLEFEKKIRSIERGGYKETVSYITDINMPYMNEAGTFTGIFDNKKFNLLSNYKKNLAKNYYSKLIKFIETKDLSDLGLENMLL